MRALKIREWGSRGRGRGREAKGREEEGGDHDGAAQSVDDVDGPGERRRGRGREQEGEGMNVWELFRFYGLQLALIFTGGSMLNFHQGEHVECKMLRYDEG